MLYSGCLGMLQVWVGCWFRLDVFAKVISHPQEKEKVSSRNRRCWFVCRSLPEPSRKGEPIQTTRVRPCCTCFLFLFLCSITICRLYKLTPSDHGQVTLQLTVNLAIRCENFSRSALAGGRKKIFPPPPEPALRGPGCYFALTVGVAKPPEEMAFYLRLV